MLGKCQSCGENVGFLKLREVLCENCMDRTLGKERGKFERTLTFSKFWGLLFFLGICAHIGLLVTSPSNVQAALSISLTVIALMSFTFSFVVRFYILRRSSHLAVALLISILFSAPLMVIAGLFGDGGSLSITTVGFIIFPYYVLRVPNLGATLPLVFRT